MNNEKVMTPQEYIEAVRARRQANSEARQAANIAARQLVNEMLSEAAQWGDDKTLKIHAPLTHQVVEELRQVGYRVRACAAWEDGVTGWEIFLPKIPDDT